MNGPICKEPSLRRLVSNTGILRPQRMSTPAGCPEPYPLG